MSYRHRPVGIRGWLEYESNRLGALVGALFLQRCESPAEQVMLLALATLHSAEWNWGLVSGLDGVEPPALFIYGNYAHGGIYPQFVVERYRLDFAIITATDKIAVEVDGHDYHERTQEQAARDKHRDRELVLLGWKVLRFTGSEVWNHADACVDQIARLLYPPERVASEEGEAV